MRNLNTRDMFNAVRLIKELDIKDEIKNAALKMTSTQKIEEETESKTEDNTKSVGFDMVFSLFEKAIDKNIELKLYEFLSGPLEVEKDEVGDMDPIDLCEKIYEIADIQKWKDFLYKAARLIK
ncbi:MAG: hypothetical protein GX275_06035 [Clostridiales bacterium]|nr:hypothetical protein [Clostridiales bacterium]